MAGNYSDFYHLLRFSNTSDTGPPEEFLFSNYAGQHDGTISGLEFREMSTSYPFEAAPADTPVSDTDQCHFLNYPYESSISTAHSSRSLLTDDTPLTDQSALQSSEDEETSDSQSQLPKELFSEKKQSIKHAGDQFGPDLNTTSISRARRCVRFKPKLTTRKRDLKHETSDPVSGPIDGDTHDLSLNQIKSFVTPLSTSAAQIYEPCLVNVPPSSKHEKLEDTQTPVLTTQALLNARSLRMPPNARQLLGHCELSVTSRKLTRRKIRALAELVEMPGKMVTNWLKIFARQGSGNTAQFPLGGCLASRNGIPVDPQSQDPRSPFACTSGCGYTTSRKIDWKRHLALNWLRSYWQCTACDKQFSALRPDKLRKHLKSSHPHLHTSPDKGRDYHHDQSDDSFRKQCGFCGTICDSFGCFVDHVGAHFADSSANPPYDMRIWRDPWEAATTAELGDDDDSGDDNDDDDDDDDDDEDEAKDGEDDENENADSGDHPTEGGDPGWFQGPNDYPEQHPWGKDFDEEDHGDLPSMDWSSFHMAIITPPLSSLRSSMKLNFQMDTDKENTSTLSSAAVSRLSDSQSSWLVDISGHRKKPRAPSSVAALLLQPTAWKKSDFSHNINLECLLAFVDEGSLGLCMPADSATNYLKHSMAIEGIGLHEKFTPVLGGVRQLLHEFEYLAKNLSLLHTSSSRSMKAFHYDLKPENILVFKKHEEPPGYLKICDFGISQSPNSGAGCARPPSLELRNAKQHDDCRSRLAPKFVAQARQFPIASEKDALFVGKQGEMFPSLVANKWAAKLWTLNNLIVLTSTTDLFDGQEIKPKGASNDSLIRIIALGGIFGVLSFISFQPFHMAGLLQIVLAYASMTMIILGFIEALAEMCLSLPLSCRPRFGISEWVLFSKILILGFLQLVVLKEVFDCCYASCAPPGSLTRDILGFSFDSAQESYGGHFWIQWILPMSIILAAVPPMRGLMFPQDTKELRAWLRTMFSAAVAAPLFSIGHVMWLCSDFSFAIYLLLGGINEAWIDRLVLDSISNETRDLRSISELEGLKFETKRTPGAFICRIWIRVVKAAPVHPPAILACAGSVGFVLISSEPIQKTVIAILSGSHAFLALLSQWRIEEFRSSHSLPARRSGTRFHWSSRFGAIMAACSFSLLIYLAFHRNIEMNTATAETAIAYLVLITIFSSTFCQNWKTYIKPHLRGSIKPRKYGLM